MSAPQPSAELVVDGLTIRFGGLTAIEGMSFKVVKGEVLSLIGPNGAGKTSAFNAITGYIVPDGGTIAYRGTTLNGLRPNRIAELGVVRTFQKTSVFMGQTVLDNVLLGLHLASKQTPLAIILGLPSVAREERALAEEARRILSFVDLERAAGAARLGAALRRAAAAGGGHRACCEAEAAAARRARLRHEPRRDRELHENARPHPRPRHHHPARRARHADGDGRVRPRRLPQPRAHHRQRHAEPRSSATRR